MKLDQIQQEFLNIGGGRGFFFQKDWSVLEVSGKDREKFLHNLLSQHVQEQAVGQRRWTTLLNSKGRLIGFFQVWKLSQKFLLVIPNVQKDTVFKTLETYWITEDIQFSWSDLSVISTFVPSQEKLLEGYPYKNNQIVEEGILRCSVDDFFIPSVWMLISSDQKQTIISSATEISNDLFDSIRIQSEFPVAGVDYEDPIPLEVPFMHRSISFTKGCYVGQETIARLHARGLNVSKKLLPFHTSIDSTISSQDTVMLNQSEVGKVTSIAFSSISKQKIGLAWIHRNAFDQKVQVKGQSIEVAYE